MNRKILDTEAREKGKVCRLPTVFSGISLLLKASLVPGEPLLKLEARITVEKKFGGEELLA